MHAPTPTPLVCVCARLPFRSCCATPSRGTLRSSDGLTARVSTEALAAMSGMVRDLLESSAGGSIAMPAWLTGDSLQQICDLADFYSRLGKLDH